MNANATNLDFNLDYGDVLTKLSRLNGSPLAGRTTTYTKKIVIVGFVQRLSLKTSMPSLVQLEKDC